ncbi:hypothetical protein HJC23_009285 [Cyclotella cryptica]|uniref:Zn(2)-C6 fungal-type domain-containing protein n=1 Tax=Cyclotella cryptica TaxID=29204 RepID=A0ABD3QW76_9STRA
MSPPPEPHGANIAAAAAAAAAKKSSRACTECHNAKGKCVFSDESRSKCDRCFRLNRECVPHLSRQGQRRKKADAMFATSAGPVATPSCPAASAGSGTTTRAPEAEASHASTRQGLLMDLLQSSQSGSSNLFAPGSSFLAHLQNAAKANAAKAQQQAMCHPAAPSSTGPPRFPEGSFNRSMLAPADQVLSSNTSTNQEQDPHIALLLRQGALANLNETRPAPAPPASTAVASLLSLLQNNQGVGSIGTPSAAPSTFLVTAIPHLPLPIIQARVYWTRWFKTFGNSKPNRVSRRAITKTGSNSNKFNRCGFDT